MERKEVESNWFKFITVGDSIKGTLINKRYQKGQDAFPDQWVYEIKKEDGQVFNVGISVNKSGTIQRLNNCQIGQIIEIEFEKEGEPGGKGFAKAKYLKVYSYGMDDSYREVTISEEGKIEDVDFTK